MKHVFVLNPVAGRENAAVAMVPHIQSAADACGIQAVLEATRAPKHAIEIARRYAAQARVDGEPVRLYAVGGDGTLNEVFNGVRGFEGAEVASVPCGSGNDFVRSFGEVEDFDDIAAQIQGEARDIDLMEVDGGVGVAITSVGLDADVAYNIPKYRRIPLLGGTMAYNISILERALHPLGRQMEITLDGRQLDGDYLIVAVCNGQTYGGGYRAAPYASLWDGMLDVILVSKIGRLLIAKIIVKYKKGEHMEDGEIIPAFREVMFYHRVREVTITPTGGGPFILNVDGECGPAPRLYARVLPSAARFVLPRQLLG